MYRLAITFRQNRVSASMVMDERVRDSVGYSRGVEPARRDI